MNNDTVNGLYNVYIGYLFIFDNPSLPLVIKNRNSI